jgi:hypothetical protein
MDLEQTRKLVRDFESGHRLPITRTQAYEAVLLHTYPAIHRLVWLMDHGDTDAVRLGAAKTVLEKCLEIVRELEPPRGPQGAPNVQVNVQLVDVVNRLMGETDDRVDAFFERRKALMADLPKDPDAPTLNGDSPDRNGDSRT